MSQSLANLPAAVAEGEISFLALAQGGAPGMAFMPASEVDAFQAALRAQGVECEVLDFGAKLGEDYADVVGEAPVVSPTGRLTNSMPEWQELPGTFSAAFEAARRRQALVHQSEAREIIQMDFSHLELRLAAGKLKLPTLK